MNISVTGMYYSFYCTVFCLFCKTYIHMQEVRRSQRLKQKDNSCNLPPEIPQIPPAPVLYTPEDVVSYGNDGDRWCCSCTSGPETQWDCDDINKKVVDCQNCGVYSHVVCRGLRDICTGDPDKWEEYDTINEREVTHN